MPTLSDREKRIRQRLKDDFPHYALKCLQIRTKSGAIETLHLNKAQSYIHERLEAQKAKTGKVRALILKGRQQGCSTYVGARFYHQATHTRGCRVFILTHEDQATQNLFDMVNRYHENVPDLVRPTTGNANAKELLFPKLDSGYKVGTAGTKGVGRSSTIQRFHGSEVAFWPNADTHSAGILQAVPDLPGTEAILESTANGLGNTFYKMWNDATAGKSDYQAIFVPWFWQEEYVRPPGERFILDDEEAEYQEAYGLSLEQMAWRRNKIRELKDPILFKQEYPATASEAFQTTGHDSFIKPEIVLRARKTKCRAVGPLIVGVDPSRYGDDAFAVAWRQGRVVPMVERKHKIDLVTGANWVKQIIDADEPDAVFIDVGGLGAGVVDILRSWGGVYARVCKPINFGGSPQEPVSIAVDGSKQPGPVNRRAEMWSRSRDWLNEVGGAQIPDDDALQADATAPGYTYDMQSRLVLEPKERMRSRGMSSPDGWDAIALTFAEPVEHQPDLYFHEDENGFHERSQITGY